MDFEEADLGAQNVAEEAAAITEAVLKGDAGGDLQAFADAVALNGAVRIYAREDCTDLNEGLEMARNTIADGDALAVLESLQAF
jgi:anthranilate phosphoribosyltransferase